MSLTEERRLEAALAAQRREREAWRIVLAGFAVFCLLLAGTPFLVAYYRDVSMSTHTARLDIIRGTVLYLSSGSRHETNANDAMEIREGDQIRTMPDSLALLFLDDGSNVQLFPDSTLRIEQSRSSTYNLNRSETLLTQLGGRSRIEVSPAASSSRQFVVQTPNGVAILREGSYGLQLSGLNGDSALDLSVRRGSASLTAAERTVEVLSGERTLARVGESPQSPVPARRDFIVNGDFANALSSWQAGNRAVEDGNPADIAVITQDGRNIIRFTRRDSTTHAETYLHQALERDVADLQSLSFSLQLKVMNQSLSGGGWLGSEYPVTVRLRYRDANGGETTWVQGFYIQNDEGRPTTYGQLLARDTWLSFTADLFDPNRVYPRPAHLLWIEVEASGWQYESMVTGIQLLGD